MLDLLTSGVMVVDENRRLVKFNDAGRRIARRPLEPDDALDEKAITALDFRDLLGKSVPPHRMPIARALCGEDPPTQDLTFVAGDPPERVTVRTSVRALRDPDGSLRGALALFTELGAEPA